MSETCTRIEMQDTLLPWAGKVGKMVGVFLAQKLREQDIDLTDKQWLMLRILSLEDGRPQNDLAILTDRNKASLVRLINTMERKMLVIRKQDELDRRINRIYLTEMGREQYQVTVPTVLQAINEVQEGLSEKEIRQAIATLEKVLQNIYKQDNQT